ncbi:Uncharacterised protein [Granulicatella adiacens]|uniref:hypothetical protein n=1 Tax=Granulicatella adiacens TaxID=46124 RepID=UPI001956C862|nr:hypothetical protein [Granulicatella adiacens]VTX65320.1 Uncharacterised protein [Granulicatella adiacens]
MKNKILLGSVTLLSALLVAACGNGEKKSIDTVATPTTEVAKETTATPTTTAPTTTAGASSTTKEVSLSDTQRVGREASGYVNVPKDWVAYQDKNTGSQFQFSSPDKYNVLSMNSYTKDSVKLANGETFGAELIANRLYDHWQNDKQQTSLQGSRAKFAGENAYLMKIAFSDGKYMYEWVIQKGEKVYALAIEGTADTINSLRPILEQSFGLDPKTPGK